MRCLSPDRIAEFLNGYQGRLLCTKIPIFALSIEWCMIQRIQTVYLSLAIIVLGILFFFPLAGFLSEMAYLKFYVTGLKNMAPEGVVPISVAYFIPLPVVMVVIIGLAGASIGLYKNRVRQIQLTNGAVMLNILMIIAILFIYIPFIERTTGIKSNFASGLGIYLPVVSLMLLVLATRAIRRDEKLVRSSDRLR